jgi:hypothetical protein
MLGVRLRADEASIESNCHPAARLNLAFFTPERLECFASRRGASMPMRSTFSDTYALRLILCGWLLGIVYIISGILIGGPRLNLVGCATVFVAMVIAIFRGGFPQEGFRKGRVLRYLSPADLFLLATLAAMFIGSAVTMIWFFDRSLMVSHVRQPIDRRELLRHLVRSGELMPSRKTYGE